MIFLQILIFFAFFIIFVYHSINNTFMKKIQQIFLLVIICLSFYGITTVQANDNMNSPEFKIDLSTMDPLQSTWPTVGGIESLTTLLGKITDIFLTFIPLLAVISLLYAGYLYILSAGDSEKAGRAKTIIKWNIVAIIVWFLSYGIVKIVAGLFDNV